MALTCLDGSEYEVLSTERQELSPPCWFLYHDTVYLCVKNRKLLRYKGLLGKNSFDGVFYWKPDPFIPLDFGLRTLDGTDLLGRI